MFFKHTTPPDLELSGEVLGRDLLCREGPSDDGNEWTVALADCAVRHCGCQ